METDTEEVVRTIRCGLESSVKKNERLRKGVEEFQDIMEFVVDIIPSFPEESWSTNNNKLTYELTVSQKDNGEFADGCLTSSVGREAGQKVAEMYSSWASNGKEGDRPRLSGRKYLRLPESQFSVEENERGYGLKASFIPYKPVWWHLQCGSHQAEYIERVFDGDAEFGSAEIFYNDGDPFVNLTVKWDVEVPKAEDVERVVGVDLGENVIYALAVRDVASGEVECVEVENGREFRHYRERLSRRRDELQRKGDLKGVKETRHERRKYTEQVTDVVSREIVKVAVEERPAVIYLEDLEGYRETADDPIHDWPFQMLQEKIMYKAKAERVPVETVDPSYTSVTCRKCGNQDEGQRDGSEFTCFECGYQVHADVNAAMNLAG